MWNKCCSLKVLSNHFLFVTLFAIFLALGVVWESDFMSMVSLLAGITCVYLAAQRNIHTFTVGIVNCLAYSYTAFHGGLYGEVILNMAFYLPMQFVGFYMWQKHMEDKKVEAKSMTAAQILICMAIVFVGTVALGEALSFFKTQNVPFLDASTFVLSVIAQFLMLARFYQQWFVYIAINVLSIMMWIQVGDGTMVLMWSAYLVNSINGLYQWKKSMTRSPQ